MRWLQNQVHFCTWQGTRRDGERHNISNRLGRYMFLIKDPMMKEQLQVHYMLSIANEWW